MGSSVYCDVAALMKTGQSIPSDDMTATALISQYDCDAPLIQSVLGFVNERRD